MSRASLGLVRSSVIALDQPIVFLPTAATAPLHPASERSSRQPGENGQLAARVEVRTFELDAVILGLLAWRGLYLIWGGSLGLLAVGH